MALANMAVLVFAFMLCTLRSHAYSEKTQQAPNHIGDADDLSIISTHWPQYKPLHRNQRRMNVPSIADRQTPRSWFGWKNINYIFSFGDSYTSTNFTTSGAQPDASNAFGNPPYPGATASNGPNYIDFMTTTYNESYIQTYNLAYGGATVNPFLVPTLYGASVRTFLSQVEKDFLPLYSNNTDVPWISTNTLFTIFFGINDCIQSYAQKNDSLNYAIIKSYEGLINELYASGARNFLFLNVPPVDRSPGQLIESRIAQAQLAGYVATFNFRLGALVHNLALRYSDTRVFYFDTNFLFTLVLDNTTLFPETAEYLNTTNYCPAYIEYVFSSYYNDSNIFVPSDLQAALTTLSGIPTLTSFYPACAIPVNKYFWLNSLHPTYPMHKIMASQIIRLLGA